MSRALGAAFLTHQVEQLEKSVSASPPRNGNGYNHNNNWRDRQRPHPHPPTDSKRGQLPVGGIRFTTTGSPTTNQPYQRDQKDRPMTVGTGPRKRGAEDFHSRKGGVKEKDADVIVVDASVLVNALGQLKKWCRDGQEEIIIVPLEGWFPGFVASAELTTALPLALTTSAKHTRPPQEGVHSACPACSYCFAYARVAGRHQPARTGPTGRRVCPLGPNRFCRRRAYARLIALYPNPRSCSPAIPVPRVGPPHDMLCPVGGRACRQRPAARRPCHTLTVATTGRSGPTTAGRRHLACPVAPLCTAE